MQGLRIDHEILSASEQNPEYQAFFMANCHACKHMYETVEDQVASAGPCLICKKEGVSCEAAADALAGPVDLMVTGSPCDPFSQQRHKRFHTGDVKQHEAYAVTMATVVGMYRRFEPHVGIVEQVKGFLMPFDRTSDETPYSRPG